MRISSSIALTRRPLRVALALSAVAFAVAGAAVGARDGRSVTAPVVAAAAGQRVSVSPAVGDRHTRFRVSLTTLHTTGVRGRVRRSYVAELRTVHPASACVNNRDRVFPEGRAGARVAVSLDPARGEGGDLGWCRGRLRGSVTLNEAFACPRRGVCHVPPGFPQRHRVVGRFGVRVR